MQTTIKKNQHIKRVNYCTILCMDVRGVMKNNRFQIFKFRELRMFDFRIFFCMLVHMSVIYIDNISYFGLSVCF